MLNNRRIQKVPLHSLTEQDIPIMEKELLEQNSFIFGERRGYHHRNYMNHITLDSFRSYLTHYLYSH